MSFEAPEKKDVAESPQVKRVEPVTKAQVSLPIGWEYYVKRGVHCVRDPNGRQTKWDSKTAALEFANL